MKTLTANVTEENISNGMRGSRCECPIALAIRDTVPTAKSILVSPLRICVELDDGRINQYVVTSEAKAFIEFFDTGHLPAPTLLEFPLKWTVKND